MDCSRNTSRDREEEEKGKEKIAKEKRPKEGKALNKDSLNW